MSIDQRPLVLQLTKAGHPQAWLTLEQAAHAIVGDRISWSFGQVAGTLHGGVNRFGVRSRIDLPSILSAKSSGGEYSKVPFTRRNLFARDRYTCLYCGVVFPPSKLTVDHILPRSQGGKSVFEMTCACCGPCNNKKRDRTPEQAGMPLLAVPYVPNRHEHLFLRNRRILADQADFLAAGFKNLAV